MRCGQNAEASMPRSAIGKAAASTVPSPPARSARPDIRDSEVGCASARVPSSWKQSIFTIITL
jgi:hypothetical protein